jgi:hypothetical protein
MTSQSVFHLERFPAFARRLVALNRMYNVDDPVLGALVLEPEGFMAFVGPAREGDGSEAGRAIAVRRHLLAIHHDFPVGAPAHEQGAYLLRAFHALRPFVTGNHRTAWDYVCELLAHNGFTVLASDAEAAELGTTVWDRVQAEYDDGFDRARVIERDAVWGFLAEWLRPRIG